MNVAARVFLAAALFVFAVFHPAVNCVSPAAKGIPELPYSERVGEQLMLLSNAMQLENLLKKLARENRVECDAEVAMLIDDSQRMVQRLGMDDGIDWDAMRELLVGMRQASQSGYANMITTLQSRMRQLFNLTNSMLGLSVTCAQCMLIEETDITSGPGIEIDGGTTWPAGSYCLKEFVDYTTNTTNPAIKVTTDNVTINFRDNTIKLSGNSGKTGVQIQADNVTIQGGSIIGSTACSDLIHVDGGSSRRNGITIEDMILSSSADGRGIYVDTAKDVQVCRVNVTLNSLQGIYLESVEGALVKDCIGLHNGGSTPGNAQFYFLGTSGAPTTGVARRNLAISEGASAVTVTSAGGDYVHMLFAENAAVQDVNTPSFRNASASNTGAQFVNNLAFAGTTASGYLDVAAQYTQAVMGAQPFGTNIEQQSST